MADAVDNDALMAIADALMLRLVFVDIAAMIAGDMQIGTRRRRSQKREQQHKRERDAHGSNEKPGRTCRIPEKRSGKATRRHNSGLPILASASVSPRAAHTYPPPH